MPPTATHQALRQPALPTAIGKIEQPDFDRADIIAMTGGSIVLLALFAMHAAGWI